MEVVLTFPPFITLPSGKQPASSHLQETVLMGLLIMSALGWVSLWTSHTGLVSQTGFILSQD